MELDQNTGTSEAQLVILTALSDKIKECNTIWEALEVLGQSTGRECVQHLVRLLCRELLAREQNGNDHKEANPG